MTGIEIKEIITQTQLEKLIRQSERLQAVRDYVNNTAYIDKEVLKILLKDGES